MPRTYDKTYAVIFGLGIPTGYGSIAPLGGDAMDSKAIGRVNILQDCRNASLNCAEILSIIQLL